MSEHPTPDVLDAFLQAALPRAATRAVVAHLAHGCAECHARLAPAAGWLLGDELGNSELAPVDVEGYDAALDRAAAAALDRHHCLARERASRPAVSATPASPVVAAPAGLRGNAAWRWELCELLIEESRALRHHDPQSALDLAELAARVVAGLGARAAGRAALADLKALVHAELANARRVADDLEGAAEALVEALTWQRTGTGDELLYARIFDLAASFQAAQRRFDRAFEYLDRVREIYLAHGEAHKAGRALISKGIYMGYAQRPADAVPLLEAGLAAIDREREPGLVRSATDGLVLALLDVGRFKQAQRLLFRSRALYAADDHRINRLKLRGLEGRIDLGLEHFARAEAAFREARDGFVELGLRYKSALAGLELALAVLEQGRAREAIETVEQAIAAFEALDIEREALGAILVLARAVRHAAGDDATIAAYLKTAISFLRQVESGAAPAR